MNDKTLLVWGRYAGLKVLPWLMLIQSSPRAIQGCPEGRSRWMISVTKLDILTIYELLDDLIRYPPY